MDKRNLVILLIVFFLNQNSIFSQGVADTQKVPGDEHSTVEYKKIYDKEIIIKAQVNYQRFEFDIVSKDEDSRKITYVPNVPFNFNFGLQYTPLDMGLSFSFKNSISETNTEKYGTTKFFDMQYNYYGTYFGCDLNFQRYRGFYIANPSDVFSDWTKDDSYPQFPHLISVGFTANAYYVFSGDKLSLAATFNQTGRQLQSAGSFLLMVSFSQLSISADRSLIPPDEQQFYGDMGSFKKGSFGSLILAPGYAFTLVLSNFYITPMLFVGPGIQSQKYNDENDEEIKINNKTFKINFRASAGYNSDSFFIVAFFMIDSTRVIVKNSPLDIVPRTVNFGISTGIKI